MELRITGYGKRKDVTGPHYEFSGQGVTIIFPIILIFSLNY
jgi:hypothetical protein